MKIFTFIICYMSFGGMHLSGQVVADSIPNKILLFGNKDVKTMRTSVQIPFKDIEQRTDWEPYDSTYKASSEVALWLKFDIENRSKSSVINYLYSAYDYTTIYQQNEKGFKKIINGFFVPLSERANPSEHYLTKIKFLPYQKSTVYVKLNDRNFTSYASIPELYSEIGYWKLSSWNYKDQEKSIGFIYFYIISLFTILVFALVFWLRLHGKLYLYYLGYLFFLLVYGFLVLRYTLAPIGNFFDYVPKLGYDLMEPVQFTFIGFYILFILQLLQVKYYDRVLAKFLYYVGIFCFSYAIFRFIYNYFFLDTEFASTLFLAIRLIILPINFILIFWIIYKVKHPLLIYFIFGQSFFFIGAILSTYIAYSGINYIPGHPLNFVEAASIIFQIGLLAEVYCFSLALGKNVFLLQKEKEKASTELIDQLQKNQLLQVTMNRELDEKVNKKTKELIQVYSKIERDREQKIEDGFIQKIKETEMVALRSQMNPHFIFNCMNAIKNLIMTSRNEDAINYLDDFASLLREILQNSNRKKITVEEELEILELYLSLEKSRMGASFSYNIQVTSKEALSQYQIPPLLLQPIVENAIWHGLHPSLKSEKNLTIIFDTSEDLKIIIEDNGIGRKESAKRKKLNASMGTAIVKERLTLHNHLNDHMIHLKITDLEEDDRALGTRITLTYEY